MTDEKQSDYNPIFTKLVLQTDEKSVERLFGMLAYAKYKLEKNRWINRVANPSSEKLEAFLAHYDDDKLQELEDQAQDTLLGYAEEYAQARMSNELSNYKNIVLSEELQKVNGELTRKINQTKVNFWLPIWQSIIASVMFTAALFVLALVIRFAAPDSNLGRLLQYLFAPDQYELQIIQKK